MILPLTRHIIWIRSVRLMCVKTENKSADIVRQTIYALSSAKGRAAISVVRISGPQAAVCLQSLMMGEKLPKARCASVRKIWNPATRILIDRSLVLWFPAPKSYTGEDSVELHLHGSPAVQFALYDALEAMPHLRLAVAGEFTRKAFDNNKLDLTEVEGIADLLQAETEAQRKQALAQATGDLHAKYKEWQSTLASQMVRLEADIDFSEVDNFDVLINGVVEIVHNVMNDMQEYLSDSVSAERVRVGCRTALIGEPNVGKSSLLNQICRRNLAIVSPRAGTTTDVLEANLDMGGYPVTLCDTAGLQTDPGLIRLRFGRELTLARRRLRRSKRRNIVSSGNPHFVEKEGMRRARKEIDNADLLLIVVDCISALEYVNYMGNNATVLDYMNLYYEAILKTPRGLAQLDAPTDKSHVLIFNKIDAINKKQQDFFHATGHLCVSTITGEGIDVLQSIIIDKVEKLCDGSRCTSPRLSKQRHRQHVKMARRFLELFAASKCNMDRAILAGALKSAVTELEHMTGESYSESLLEALFSEFCIGK